MGKREQKIENRGGKREQKERSGERLPVEKREVFGGPRCVSHTHPISTVRSIRSIRSVRSVS